MEEESEEEEEEGLCCVGTFMCVKCPIILLTVLQICFQQLHHGSHGRRRSKGVPTGGATKHDPVICGRKNVRNMEKVK